MRNASAFQSVVAAAVLLPESFRGGCSFGAAKRDLSRNGAPRIVPTRGRVKAGHAHTADRKTGQDCGIRKAETAPVSAGG